MVFDAISRFRGNVGRGVHAVGSSTQGFETSGRAWEERGYQGRIYLGGRCAILSSTGFVMLTKKLFIGGVEKLSPIADPFSLLFCALRCA